jgi:hypothetical protein
VNAGKRVTDEEHREKKRGIRKRQRSSEEKTRNTSPEKQQSPAGDS